MGGGDVKMLAMIGAFLGWKLVVLTLVFSSVAGSLVGVLVIAIRSGRDEVRAALRNVPLARRAGASLFGERIVDWYLGSFTSKDWRTATGRSAITVALTS